MGKVAEVASRDRFKCIVFLVAVSTVTNSCNHCEDLHVFIKLKVAF